MQHITITNILRLLIVYMRDRNGLVCGGVIVAAMLQLLLLLVPFATPKFTTKNFHSYFNQYIK